MRVSTPQALLIGLYLRDAAGLPSSTRPEVPPVDPPVEVRVRPPAVEVAGEQWSRWWTHALDAAPEALGGILPPHFTGLRGMPELRGVAELLVDEAVEWSWQQREREARLLRQLPTALFETNLVRQVEEQVGRKLLGLDLEVLSVPVRGVEWWPLSGGRFLMTMTMREDRDAYLAWLRDRVADALRRSGGPGRRGRPPADPGRTGSGVSDGT